LGRIYSKQFRLDEALIQYGLALHYLHDDPIVLRELGWTYIELKDYNKAKEYFEKAMKLGTDDDLVYEGYALALAKSGNLVEAIKLHDKLLKYSNDTSQLFDYGFFFYLVGDYDNATRYYILELDDNPNHVPAIIELARIKVLNGQDEEALKLFAKALELDPNNYYVYNKKGWIYRRIGNINKSIEMYENSVVLRPKDTNEAFNELARLYLLIDDIEKARMILERSIEVSPYNLWATNELKLLKADNLNTCFDYAKLFNMIQDKFQKHDYETACQTFREGRYEEAILLFENLSLPNTDFGYSKVEIAIITSFLGEWNKSADILLQLEEIEINKALLYNELGWIYFNQYDFIEMNESLYLAARLVEV